jgi:hypothetical protein
MRVSWLMRRISQTVSIRMQLSMGFVEYWDKE